MILRFTKYLVKDIGVAAVPGSSFYRDPRDGARKCVLHSASGTRHSTKRRRRLRKLRRSAPERYTEAVHISRFAHPVHQLFCGILRLKCSHLPGITSYVFKWQSKRYQLRFPPTISRRWKTRFIARLNCTRPLAREKPRPSGTCSVCDSNWKNAKSSLNSLRREMVQLRKDREEVRARVEKMLHQIESLGEEQAAS